MDHRLAAIIAAFFIMGVGALRYAFSSIQADDFGGICLITACALVAIFGAEPLGDYMGWAGHARITRRTPAWVFVLLGWIILLVMAIMIVFASM